MNEALRLRLDIEAIMVMAAEACAFIEGMTLAEFKTDRRTQQAVIMNLLVVGEGVTKLATRHEHVLLKYPDVPWGSIRAMRNRIAHGYESIDLDVVWRTVTESLTAFITQLEVIHSGLKEED